MGFEGAIEGVTIKQMYWTLGQYDQVCVFEAPNDETAASVLLSADMLGNIRTKTLRCLYQRRDGEDSRQHSLTAVSRRFSRKRRSLSAPL